MRVRERESAHCQDSWQVKWKGKYPQGLPKTYCIFGTTKITENFLTDHTNGIASANATILLQPH